MKFLEMLENKFVKAFIIFAIIGLISVIAGDVIVKEGNMDVENNFTVDTTTFFVDAVNNSIGIGTTTPGEKLEISGAGTQRLQITETGSSVKTQLKTATTGGFVGTSTNNDFYLLSNDTIRVIIKDNGKVKIGTTTPLERLDVLGNVRADSYIEYSEIFTGDALGIINNVRARGVAGDWSALDHSSLPDKVRKEYIEDETCENLDLPEDAECINLGNGKSKVYGRVLNDMIAINTRALQQLIEKIESLEAELCLMGKTKFC